jgi:hypothetical protein
VVAVAVDLARTQHARGARAAVHPGDLYVTAQRLESGRRGRHTEPAT